jgi:hypothetical protein
MISSLWERIKQLGMAGIGIKIAAALGGAVLVGVLHALIWDLIAPAVTTIWYIIAHAGVIFKK